MLPPEDPRPAADSEGAVGGGSRSEEPATSQYRGHRAAFRDALGAGWFRARSRADTRQPGSRRNRLGSGPRVPRGTHLGNPGDCRLRRDHRSGGEPLPDGGAGCSVRANRDCRHRPEHCRRDGGHPTGGWQHLAAARANGDRGPGPPPRAGGGRIARFRRHSARVWRLGFDDRRVSSGGPSRAGPEARYGPVLRHPVRNHGPGPRGLR